MPHLSKLDIQTSEVLDWMGVHLLHFAGSSCSQKTRIFLNLKGIEWQSHHVDLTKGENHTDWFMGVNPRGLVPVLVHDGDVVIESNDILVYLDETFPNPKLIPAAQSDVAKALLKAEDDLHLDLRALSMRYLFGPMSIRNEDQLKAYEAKGSGTVGGQRDAHKDVELRFFREMAANGGITDSQVKAAATRFHAAFAGFDAHLANHSFLLGDRLSVIDIAWYIYAVRLIHASYPLHRLHKHVGAWFDGLNAKPEFSKEVQMPPPMIAARDAMHAQQKRAGTTLELVAGL
ncbi:MAG: glutathione S-transferase family protein [Pseudomonadota bacterium]